MSVSGEYSNDFNRLKKFGNEYAKKELFRPKPVEPEKVTYDPNMLLVGRNAEKFICNELGYSTGELNPEYGKAYHIDLNEAVSILVVGIRGGGKTFFLSRISSVLMETNRRAVLFLNDCKREFAHGRRPIQSKFRHLLFENEVPKGFNIVSLRPTYFKGLTNVSEKKHPDDFWYSPQFSKMSKQDFITLINGKTKTVNQNLMIALEMLFDELEKVFRREPDIEFSLELFDALLEMLPKDIKPPTRSTIRLKIMGLVKTNLFDKKYELDLTELVKRGYYPSINMENYTSFDSSAYDFNNFTLSLIQQELINSRIPNRPLIKPLFIFFDEMARFITKKRPSSIKDNTINNIGLYRAKGVSYCLQEDTLIKTNNGNKKIKDLDVEKDRTISWDFKENKLVETKFKKYNTGKKKLIELTLMCGDKIKLTKDHIMFRLNENNKISEVQAKNLKINNFLIKLRKSYNQKLYGEQIISIEEIEEDNCFDLEVPENHNFFLANRILSHNCIGTQNIGEVPTEILDQSMYLFVPSTTNTDTIRELLLSSGIPKNEQIAKNHAIRLKNMSKGIKYSWICINRYTGSYNIVVPAPPLNYLKESSQKND